MLVEIKAGEDNGVPNHPYFPFRTLKKLLLTYNLPQYINKTAMFGFSRF